MTPAAEQIKAGNTAIVPGATAPGMTTTAATPPIKKPNVGLIAGIIGGVLVLGTVIAVVAVKRSGGPARS